jgi:hypothetical protein
MQLILTVPEAVMLAEILEVHRSDLRMDIAGTDVTELREQLMQREAFLDKILSQLQEVPSSWQLE